MKLGYAAGYWSSGPPPGIEDSIAEAERLGFDSIWTAEAYGSDALTPLAWWGAKTSRIKLGTAIAQISGRTPAATAMAALTLDHLSGGRFILGLGASGPQVVEGWYGRPYPRPLERTREYIEIIRRILAREAPVEFSGHHYQMPYQGGTGLGKPLKSTVHPLRADVPIYLGAEGPKNVAMAAEIADGWLPIFYSPKSDKFYRDALAEGFARPSARRTMADFEIPSSVPIIVNDDLEAAADVIRPMLALYVGGMGARGANFHFEVLARLGYEELCIRIQDLYLAGKKREAMAAVPLSMVEDTALIGPLPKIKDDLAKWKETAITTLLVGGPPKFLETVAKVVG
ncbi:MAG: LLM class F420-dependent oxidoreductase [Chloroflexota bacterium]|nr:LLM class F420-dependent oxidoreductase [Chloroflexota bacterium]